MRGLPIRSSQTAAEFVVGNIGKESALQKVLMEAQVEFVMKIEQVGKSLSTLGKGQHNF